MVHTIITLFINKNYEECKTRMKKVTQSISPILLFIQLLPYVSNQNELDILLHMDVVDWKTDESTQNIILYSLASNGQLTLLTYLIERKSFSYDIRVAIHACRYHHIECLEYYFQLGNTSSKDIMTEAIRSDDLELVKCCLKWGCDIEPFIIITECFSNQQFTILSYIKTLELEWFSEDSYPYIMEEIERHNLIPTKPIDHLDGYQAFIQDCRELVSFYGVVELDEYINQSAEITKIDPELIQLFLQKERDMIYNSDDCLEECILAAREICPLFLLYISECYSKESKDGSHVYNYVRLECIRRTCLYMMEYIPSIYPISRMNREIDVLSEKAEEAFSHIQDIYYLLIKCEEKGIPKHIVREYMLSYF